VNAGDVFVVEHGRHWLDALQKAGNSLNVLFLEHSRLFRGRQRVVRDRVPGSENDVVERCQGNEILDQR
jgi:hypothetical protein